MDKITNLPIGLAERMYTSIPNSLLQRLSEESIRKNWDTTGRDDWMKAKKRELTETGDKKQNLKPVR